MAKLVTIREPGAEPIPLAIDGELFADPDTVTIDEELPTAALYALPGLADCHAHLGMVGLGEAGPSDQLIRANTVRHAWAQIEHGVLLICDKGSASDVTLEILDTPPEKRPEIQMAGRMIAAQGGYYPDFAVEVDGAGLAAAVAAACGPHGWVKIVADWPRRGIGPVANFSAEMIATAVGIAHEAGCRVAAHTLAPAGIAPVIEGGVDSVEHGPFMSESDLRRLAARNGCWVPTVLGVEALVDFLGEESSGGRLLVDGLNNVRELLPLAAELGVTILTGTDLAVPHGRVAEEAVRLADYGLDPASVVKAASTAAYDYLGVDRVLAPGARADAVFFAENPTEKVGTLTSPVLVIRRGRPVWRI